MTTLFRNLIFEGGGVKGIAYIGAMQILEQRRLLKDIIRVGGTSAGAINALLFALGYTIAEQRDIIGSTDFRKFMDDSFGVIRDIRRLARDFGWYKGDFFTGWIGGLIRKKLGKETSTFRDLEKAGLPGLYMTGTNLSTCYSEVFSVERQPDMPLASAVRISMSIPLFFAAVHYNKDNDVYVDGGCMVNYPIKLFDRERYIDMANEAYAARRTDYYNKENAVFLLDSPGRSPYVYNRQTLGMRLDTAEEIALYRYNENPRSKQIKNFTEYARALISALTSVQENQHLHSDDWHRTIYISTLDIGTTDFDLNDSQKEALIREGVSGTENYFRWFENPQEQPANRIGY